MKKSISVQLSEEKLSAIEMYLEQKNTTLTAELDKLTVYGDRSGLNKLASVPKSTKDQGEVYKKQTIIK